MYQSTHLLANKKKCQTAVSAKIKEQKLRDIKYILQKFFLRVPSEIQDDSCFFPM